MLRDQQALIRSLSRTFKQPRLFETHISWVLVTQDFAYKIKKAVRYAFLDFSTLDLRRFYCNEELRLNARLSPELYLAVVPIAGTPDAPAVEGQGTPIEYAVKMRAFPQQAIWNARLQAGCLLPAEIDALAHKLAQIHQHAAVAAAGDTWGSSQSIRSCGADNLAEISALLEQRQQQPWADAMMAWQGRRQEQLSATFDSRKAQGRVRECHADLHCGNILTIDDQVSVFDCIEFNDSLRWIDVMDDIAFTCMDLRVQQRPDLAARLLNRYLASSGDYQGLLVFRYYLVERALVRCKVALLRAQQSQTPDMALAARYMAFASEQIQPVAPVLLLMHGFSGSGKSSLAECLVEAVGAIQIRSDVERKRMHGLPAVSDRAAAPMAGLYDAAATQLTYARLTTLARQVLESGLHVIVDAASLLREQRRPFQDLARELAVPFFILDVQARAATMRARIAVRQRRANDPSDADLATLAHQIAHHDTFSDDELEHVIAVDGETRWDQATIAGIVAAMASRDGPGARQ